ncbi:MAG: polysaccharide biosynthesis/export family protein [Phycisphaerae bacterium]|nr:polysaccharide biosynthesis/export family protein [Phycisphaerae bacterium]
MRRKTTQRDRLTKATLLCTAMGQLLGCAALPPNSLFNPANVGQFPLEYTENEIRRVLTARDTPLGPKNTTEPTPADLEASFDEYLSVPGDTIQVQIPDLVATGQVFQLVADISEAGELRLPEIGVIKVTGKTEKQIEEAVTQALKDAQILPDPAVQLSITNRRNRIYSIIGSVAAAGPYPIPTPDFRLLDAIAFARDIGPEVTKLYVIRRIGSGPSGSTPMSGDQGKDWWSEPVAEEPTAGRDMPFFSSDDGPRGGTGATKRNAGLDDDLDQILARTARGGGEETGSDGPLRFERTDELSDQPAKKSSEPRRGSGRSADLDLPKNEPFDWDDVPELDSTQRVIEIDVAALKNGDPRYNIVVKDRDIIQVPVDNGVFYMMGEVNRPGVFALGGREITIKQALALAGGFSQLAWPQRCEIIRREQGTDKQLTIPVDVDAIFGGRAPDVMLRPDDIFNAGTHVIAPFLFVLRNSFRFTYGFGFVYDRNFADKDSYFGRNNPQSVAEQDALRRGLPF